MSSRAFFSYLALVAMFACSGGALDPDAGLGDASPGADTSDEPDADTGPLNGWQRLSDLPWGVVQAHGVVALDGVIYVLGGFDRTGPLDAVWAYHVEDRMWVQARSMPQALHHVNVAAVDGKLYVLGGLAGSQTDQVGVVWEYDPATDDWSDRAPLIAAQARGAAGVAVHDGSIYLIGGHRQRAAVSLVSRYDPVENSWQHNLAPLPTAREQMVSATVDGLIYAVGGRLADLATSTDQVDVYDPETNQWATTKALPGARSSMAGGVLDGRIVVAGGDGNEDGPSGLYAETLLFNPEQDEWVMAEPLLTPRRSAGGAVHDGALYMPGGATSQLLTPSGLFERFLP